MNTKTNIYENAKHGLANGINICRNAVDHTLGKGTNVIIVKDLYPYYIQTKDAFSIIQSIKCEDPLENQAVLMLKDATDSMNKRAKDGRTTMCILTDEIMQRNPPPDELANAVPEIERLIDSHTRQISVDEVEAVARTASDSERLGKLIASVYKAKGKDCIINDIEGSGTYDDEVVYHEGVRLQGVGFVSPYLVHDEEAKKASRTETRAIYENPRILIAKRPLRSDTEIGPLIDGLHRKEIKDLVILGDKIDSNLISNLIATHTNGLMNILILKPPVIWKDEIFEDFALATGSTIISDESGIQWKDVELQHLGTCGKIIADKDETTITGIKDISEHIENLKNEGTELAKIRAWYLSTKTATLRLGANNEGELSLLRLKAQDAIHSSQLALESGIVAGGGVCLMEVSRETANPVLKESLKAPMKQIFKNAGQDETLADGLGDKGMDAYTGNIVDMFKAGIVDSSAVVKNAVRNAIAIATIALTTEKLIDKPRQSLEEKQLEILNKQQMQFR